MRRIEEELPEGYSIKHATIEDIPAIMDFIKYNWKENHIFATNREYFEYEFLKGKDVCYILLCDQCGAIRGTLGYIPYDIEGSRNIFTVLWKVADNGGSLFGGVQLLQYIYDNCACDHIYTIGLNVSTVNIYKYLRLSVVKLDHYYIINPNVEQHLSAGTKESIVCHYDECEFLETTSVDELENIFDSLIQDQNILKSLWYIKHRYYENPIYTYRKVLVKNNNSLALVIMREQICNEVKILRVIDCIGYVDAVYKMAAYIERIIKTEGYEYADLYIYGLDSEKLIEAGWNIVDSENTIIPNYFNPFEQKNVDIYAMHEKDVSPVFFKGDGDQDRP